MERLTERLNNLKKGVSQMGDKEEIKANKNFLKYVCEYLEQLKSYKDAEEQGVLVRLPCKVGDKAWYVRNSVIDEVEVDSFVLNTNLFVKVSLYVGYERYRKTLTPYKTLFFSLEEAEQALENMKSEG